VTAAGAAVRHVVWDWNGTLVDDQALVMAAVNDALGHLRQPPIRPDDYRTHFTRPLELFYQRLLGRPLALEEWTELDRVFHDAYRRRLGEVALAADAWRALALARAWGLGQSLLSMWRHDDLVPLVAHLGIAGWFERVDGLKRSEGGSKAGHLARHLAVLGMDGARVLVVGDTLDDATAAAAVGARCVLYDGGTHHRHALEAAGVPVVGSLVAALEVGAGPRPQPAPSGSKQGERGNCDNRERL
jgi:phosphoglycolate phosphatase-like HAD superfamily hydrolase